MKRKLIALQAVIAVAFAVSAIAASAALAAPEWYVPKAPEWQQSGVSLSEASATKWKGTVTIVDNGEENASVECETSGEGSAGPGAVDKETTWSFAGCHLVHAGKCTKFESVKAVGLPWHTELVYSGKAIHDVIHTEGTGQTGFQINCTFNGLKLGDNCTAKTLETSTANVSVGVSAALIGQGVKCLGGGEGSLSGTQTIEASKGAALEANRGAFTKLGSSLGATSTGALTIEDRGFKIGLNCGAYLKGTLEPGGKGTISAWEATACKPVGMCESVNTVVAVNLPWHTELVASGGTIRDRIVSGGSGTPQWKFECTGLGARWNDTCGVNTSPQVWNLSSEVEAVFEEIGEHVVCSDSSQEKAGVWLGKLKIAPSESVPAVQFKE